MSTWERYERLRRTTLLAWASLFPLAGLLLVLPRAWVASRLPLVVFLIGVPMGVALFALSLRVNFWPCPNCAKPFFLRYGFWRTAGKQCPHCGLNYGEETLGRDRARG